MIGARYEIEGRTVLLTGAARGIGADAARRLADRGARLALVDRDAEALERRAAELAEHGEVLALPADVTDAEALAQVVRATRERFCGIDVVIANAGISGSPTPVTAIDPAEFEQVIEINLLGVWRTVHAALPDVVARKGYVLPIASVAAVVPCPLVAAYAASKHGVEGFADSIRMELAHTGTRVGVGYFSFIDTDMVRDAFADPDAAIGLRALPGFLSRPIPVGAAGAAIVRGVERRARRVYAPRWVPALIAARGLGGPMEALAARHPRLIEACRAAEARVSDTAGDGPAAAPPGEAPARAVAQGAPRG
ncbi:MAG: short-chain dehydrogenase/reductase [Solirubrobacterales bacterium]